MIEIGCNDGDLSNCRVADRGAGGSDHIQLKEQIAEREIRRQAQQLASEHLSENTVMADGKAL
ncbi:hypothetical protein [Cyanobium sp. ATX 6A2]|uniref:hypothetical protein n=1 Tax=Cyanobium sp. ATX 6A2 TaxID=2823700 RepID=UPI0020CD1352|nr:hypothetical protein [Cyanobium sp. ATX 6A2]